MQHEAANVIESVRPESETTEVAGSRSFESLVGLRFPSRSDSIIPVTQNQRKGRLMSRRCAQRGRIERKGRWWHLRFWFDIPEGRIHKSQPICLAVGKEKKNKSEAERLGVEWLAKQGINTKEHLAKATGTAVTFQEQSQIWLNWLQTRIGSLICAQL